MMTILLLVIAAVSLIYLLWPKIFYRNKQEGGLKKIPGPTPWPFLGSLHLLNHPEGPFVGFNTLAQHYGEIFKIQLGSSECVVISSFELIKEVLITRGSHFGGRPDFLRFHQLFGGNRNNSLALCDWSDLQRQRRSIARTFCSPRGGSHQLKDLSTVAVRETQELIKQLKKPNQTSLLNGNEPFKPVLQCCVANIFTQYMCSTRFGYEDSHFNKVVHLFDAIFWDINQGCALDFIPSLKPFYSKYLGELSDWGAEIRSFILDKIIKHRRATLDPNAEPRDFTDALLNQLELKDSDMNWQHIMYELEDFLGGHSAIGNLTALALANAIIRPGVQKKIQQEIDEVSERLGCEDGVISMEHRSQLPYTEAVMWETLRTACSPIVPHTATQDTVIDGHYVKKGTVVFLNNLELNLGEKHWGPDRLDFKPERFLVTSIHDGVSRQEIQKPKVFMPFSTGKRTCIGQKLVQGCTIVMLASLLRNFDVSSADPQNFKQHMTTGCVALPPETFHITLTPRQI